MEILKKEIILSKKSIKFIVKPNKKNYEGYCVSCDRCGQKTTNGCGTKNDGGGGGGCRVHAVPIYAARLR